MATGARPGLDRTGATDATPRGEHGAAGTPGTSSPITIIIKSYNYEQYLRDAIQSVLAQSLPPSEIIVVDDGSTDGSRNIIAEFQHRVTVILREHQGETNVVNAAFAASRGQIIMYLDADDALNPSACEELVAAWRPDCVKVQFALEIMDADGSLTGAIEPIFPPDYGAAAVRRSFAATNTYIWPPTSGNAYARWFLDQILPLAPSHFPRAVDGILSTIAPLFGEICTVGKPLGRYRIHGGNMWALSNFSVKRIDEYLAQRQREIDHLRSVAREKGVSLSDSNPLDHSLAFLRYRLASAKLGPRRSRQGAGPLRICLRARRCLADLNLPRRQRTLELLWFVVVALSFRPLARPLIELRMAAGRSPWLNRLLYRLHLRPLGRRRSA
jgi:hypothetical protein